MNQGDYNFYDLLISSFSLVFTIVGLVAIYVQIRDVKKSLWSENNSRLCEQSFELLKFLNSDARSYDYFYNKKVLSEGAPERTYILYAAEAIANFLEHLVLQQNNLPPRQWEVWNNFIKGTLAKSIVLNKFILENRDWYNKTILEYIKENN